MGIGAQENSTCKLELINVSIALKIFIVCIRGRALDQSAVLISELWLAVAVEFWLKYHIFKLCNAVLKTIEVADNEIRCLYSFALFLL